MGVIYGLIDSDTLELRYVGQTVQPLAARLRAHRSAHDNHHLRNWLRARPVSTITLERNPADLNEAERRWVAAMRAEGARLINMTDGGDGGGFAGRRHTDAARAKTSAALRRHYEDPAARVKIGAAHVGFKHSVEARANMSAARIGLKHSAEARANISAAMRRSWEAKREV